MSSTPEDLCGLRSAGGNALKVCGRATLDLSINHLSMSHEFVVVENLTLSVLIGCDFMNKFQIRIDFVNMSKSFMENLMVAKLLNQSSEWGQTARTLNSVVFKPYTETTVRVSLPKAYRRVGAVILEPMTRFGKSTVLDSTGCGPPGRANHSL